METGQAERSKVKLSLIDVVIFVTGGVLIYSAVTNRDPREVVKLALTGKPPAGAKPISTPLPSNAPDNSTPLPNANPFLPANPIPA